MKILRNHLSTLHGFIGILGGVLLVVMGLTGSSIVSHQEIDRALNPQLMQVAPQIDLVGIDAVVSAAQANFPGSRLESIQIPQTLRDTYRISQNSFLMFRLLLLGRMKEKGSYLASRTS
jgi:uncharacterized iron-regulated membrane protein